MWPDAAGADEAAAVLAGAALEFVCELDPQALRATAQASASAVAVARGREMRVGWSMPAIRCGPDPGSPENL
jgi:hypothetical protein